MDNDTYIFMNRTTGEVHLDRMHESTKAILKGCDERCRDTVNGIRISDEPFSSCISSCYQMMTIFDNLSSPFDNDSNFERFRVVSDTNFDK